MNLRCELYAFSDVEHLQQIYTGFGLLHQQGFLKLKQIIPAEFLQNKSDTNRWTDYKFFNTKVIINEKVTIYYDAHDWNWIDEKILHESDFYFKRSYDTEYVSTLAEKRKVFPLGLNYQIASDKRDFFKLERGGFYPSKDQLKTIIKSLKIADSLGFDGETEQLKNLEALPDFGLEPKILFMARAWNTETLQSKNQTEAVAEINETRAECVRRLRKEFGARFYGGLAHDDFSIRNFKDCLIPDNNLSGKRKYLEMVKSFPICVATTGLNRSNGWKLGEYVALSKAIITEPLHFQVPGNFAAEKNYLEFTAPDELVEQATRLFEDKTLRCRMMMDNHRYYLAYQRPDAMILNSLAVVFEHADLIS